MHFLRPDPVGFHGDIYLCAGRAEHSSGPYTENGQARGATRIEANEAAEKKWVQTIIEKARQTEAFQEQCTPGYYNNEGAIPPEAKHVLRRRPD